MRSLFFILCLVLVFSASINLPSQVKSGSQDTTKIEYWKNLAKEAEARARLNEANAIQAKRQKFICEKTNQEMNKLIEEQKKTIEQLKSKAR